MEPITRKEKYLAKISGEDVQIPEKPITREEMYLNAINAEIQGFRTVVDSVNSTLRELEESLKTKVEQSTFTQFNDYVNSAISGFSSNYATKAELEELAEKIESITV